VVEAALGVKPSSLLHPDLAVAEGAAIVAHQETAQNRERIMKQYPSFGLTVRRPLGHINDWSSQETSAHRSSNKCRCCADAASFLAIPDQ
jgi:molecular chaperone DnaK (HSP70)